MKKILLFLLLSVALFSCEEATYENSVTNPEKFTTIEMTRATIVVSYDDTTIYKWEDGLVTEKYTVDGGDYVMISLGWLFWSVLSTFLIALIVFGILTDGF